MKICKAKGCNKKHYGKGFCRNHYVKLVWYVNPANRKYHRKYQKQYRLKKYGIGLKMHKCKIRGCQNKTNSKSLYCYPHKNRIKNNLSTNLSISYKHFHPNYQGSNNPRWKGGISEYTNHSLMKKNRLIILMQNPKCEICGKPATEIHHKDGSKTNHRLSNLVAVCHKCHPRPKTHLSKYRKKYGMSLKEIGKKIGYSKGYVGNLIKNFPQIIS
jgi:hypothetical protein